MIIKYLQLMQDTKLIFGEKNKPVKESDITLLEQKINKNFPKAYKEFLFIGGDDTNVFSELNHGFYHPNGGNKRYIEEIQEHVKSFLKEEKLNIEGEFWVINDSDGGEQFDFFYFNDTEAEDPENPPVYASYPGYLDEGAKLKEKIADSFSQYINDKIEAYTKDA